MLGYIAILLEVFEALGHYEIEIQSVITCDDNLPSCWGSTSRIFTEPEDLHHTAPTPLQTLISYGHAEYVHETYRSSSFLFPPSTDSLFSMLEVRIAEETCLMQESDWHNNKSDSRTIGIRISSIDSHGCNHLHRLSQSHFVSVFG